MINRQILLSIYTDTLSLFDVFEKSIMTTEKKSIVDLKSIKNLYKNMEV